MQNQFADFRFRSKRSPHSRRGRPGGCCMSRLSSPRWWREFNKFFHFLTNRDQYVAPWVASAVPFTVHSLMLAAGVIEIVAALIVAFWPRIGAWIVFAWLCVIIVNLLAIPSYYDIALRDAGLALGAAALARLSVDFESKPAARQ